MCVHLYCMLVCECVCTWLCAHVFLTSLLRHSSRESGVKWKSGSHSVGIHGSGPRGPVRAPVFTDKASPAGPRHTHTERGATEGEERRRGGDKVTRGEENGEGLGEGNRRRSVWQLSFQPRMQMWRLSCITGELRPDLLWSRIWSFVWKSSVVILVYEDVAFQTRGFNKRFFAMPLVCTVTLQYENVMFEYTCASQPPPTTFNSFFSLLLAESMNLSYSPPGEQAPPSIFTSANPVSLFQRSLLPLALSQQLELLGFHENFFHLAVPSLFPLPGPFPRSGSLVHCVLKQPVCMYRKGAPKWGGPSLTRTFRRDRLALENLYTSFSLLMNSRVS